MKIVGPFLQCMETHLLCYRTFSWKIDASSHLRKLQLLESQTAMLFSIFMWDITSLCSNHVHILHRPNEVKQAPNNSCMHFTVVQQKSTNFYNKYIMYIK